MVAVVQKRTCRVRLQSKGFDRVFSIEKNLELFDEIGHTIKKISSLLPGIWPPDLIEADDKNVRIGLIGIPKVGDGFRFHKQLDKIYFPTGKIEGRTVKDYDQQTPKT
ncbi:MAG: hypothetical protein E3K29_02210 [Candidatus Brocadia sp.]|nr:hypothetical protein [Candidatus Brocadia sp.]